ncbi:MAG TPA: aldo/keto reductase [Candidatus Saccharimonadales bacterium]|jgi:diketogulonate reductase-like aldo/keto reductase
MTVPNVRLDDTRTIPQIGLGFWKVKDQSDFKTAFDAAIQCGYRLFDSAQAYGNEQFLGECVKEAAVKRQDLFITSKIAVQHFGHARAISSFNESISKLGMDYVDLMLLHFPVSVLRKRSWQALEELKDRGLIKSIGVSNYTIRHLEEMKTYAKEMPVINQVELHVFLQQPELLEYCRKEKIQVEAYSPLAHGVAMDDPIIQKLARKYSKTYAQIMLRFLIQLDVVVIPKSVTPSRIQENIEVFDFKLSSGDMTTLKGLDRNQRTCWDPTRVP